MARFAALTLLLALGACANNERTCNEGVERELDVPDTDVGDLSGLSGLELWCTRYRQCGGLNYATTESCVTATLGCWGNCAERRSLLDAFGECMAELPCEDYEPDAYNPEFTECAEQWSALDESKACRG